MPANLKLKIIILWLAGWLNSLLANDIPWHKLQTGDLLLFSMPCRVCQLIELEEGAPYSHMAMVFKTNGKFFVTESWIDGVTIKSHKEFLQSKKFTNGSHILILRHQTKMLPKYFSSKEFGHILKHFLGKKFDPDFLWDNIDSNKQQKYYCSEFIYKFYQLWLKNNFLMNPKAMSFQKYYLEWKKYFTTTIPEGLPGVSPTDFSKNFEFKSIFKINVDD